MATNKRVFTLRLSDEVFDKIGVLATREHRSMTNYIEYVLLKHINDIEAEQGEIKEENDRAACNIKCERTNTTSNDGYAFYRIYFFTINRDKTQ